MLKSRPKLKRFFKNTTTKTKKFFMKWRFRLDQSRIAFSLITFALILAEQYKAYFFKVIPFFDADERAFGGLVVFTLMIFVAFMLGGYIYDKVLKLWTETSVVGLERNPYSYVPAPKDEILWQGYWAYLFYAVNEIAEKMKIELKWKDLTKYHMEQYYKLKTTTPAFIQKSLLVKEISALLQKVYVEEDISKDEVNEILDRIKKDMDKIKSED